MFKQIIWATDGSEAAERALSAALELVEATQASLLVVHADEQFSGRAGGFSTRANEEEIDNRLEAHVRELSESGVDASYRIVRGISRDPADLIADVARDTHADAIVVGTRGHGRLAGALLGSVAQRLLPVAPCPVLAVPARVNAPAATR